jgi:hypothetical protein
MVMKSAKDNVPIVFGITAPGRNHCKYDLAINPKAAKVLGLDVPPTKPWRLLSGDAQALFDCVRRTRSKHVLDRAFGKRELRRQGVRGADRSLLALASSEASTFLYSSFVCQAVGARSVGCGRSFFVGEAKVIALSRCARRSGICTISYCVPGY